MQGHERVCIAGFADLVDGGTDDTWRVWGFTSAAAMSVSMLLDDIDGDNDDPDELAAALTGLDAPHQEAIAVALGRWCGTRSATCSEEEAVNPTLDALGRHVELLKGLGDPLAAHDAQALSLLHDALVGV